MLVFIIYFIITFREVRLCHLSLDIMMLTSLLARYANLTCHGRLGMGRSLDSTYLLEKTQRIRKQDTYLRLNTAIMNCLN